MPARAETLQAFYQQKSIGAYPAHHYGQFNVFKIEDRIARNETSPGFLRRDFYKVMLYRGDNIFHFPGKNIQVSGSTLLFFNPRVPYSYNPMTPGTGGYFCVFKEEYLNTALRMTVSEHPLFSPGAQPVFALQESEAATISDIFNRMLTEINTGFAYKYELIRAYLLELMFYALKLAPIPEMAPVDASDRTARLFTELLERQFPIESPGQAFSMRLPKHFAGQLHMHVNHLNRAIMAATGKTTSAHIAARLAAEAMALLQHTGWMVAEIGYSLGFEDPAHFTHFFRRQTGSTPIQYRKVCLKQAMV